MAFGPGAGRSALYVGTLTGDIYIVDPNALVVTERVAAATIGPDGYPTYGVFALADGRFLLMGDEVGYPDASGYDSFAIWDKSSNSLSKYITAEGQQVSLVGQSACGSLVRVGNIALNATRTKVFLSGGGTVCQFDPSSGESVTGNGQGINAALPTPDGKNFLSFGAGNVFIWDASSMTITDQFALPTYFGADTGLLSLDGNTLYTVGVGFNTGIILAYQWRTHTVLGWTNVPVANLNGDLTPMAIDETGLVAGTAGGLINGGLGFADVSSLQTGPYRDPNLNDVSSMEGPYLTTQNVGPVTGGTSVQFNSTPDGQTATGMYFDHQPVSTFTTENDGQSLPTFITDTLVVAAAPPHGPGPVDVAITTSAGASLVAFAAFSYGPYVTYETGSMSTAEGGGTATLVGYGFYDNSAQSNLEVQVGGQAVPVTYSTGNYNGEDGIPLQVLQFTIPPGQAGTSAPISITNPFGSTTAPAPITYLPAVQTFPLPGASLAQGVYDAKHQLYYFTDLTEIRVFSRASLNWQAPISLPNPSGGTQELVGVALSPDQSKLAVSDDGTNYIYVLNTDNPAAVNTFALPSTGMDAGSLPSGLAISDTGMVYYASYKPNSYGGDTLHKLDSNTGVVTPYQTIPAVNQYDQYDSHVLITGDNAYVYYLATDGAGASLYKVSTATDEGGYVPKIYCANQDMALSPDGQRLMAGDVFFDGEANPQAYVGRNLFFSMNLNPVDGEKFSADGKLLFQPQEQSIWVIDAATSSPVQQIGLPFNLSLHFDALVSDGTDNILVAISDPGDGIALIDLSAVPEPAHTPSSSGSWISASGVKSLPLTTSKPDFKLPARDSSQHRVSSARKLSWRTLAANARSAANVPAAPISSARSPNQSSHAIVVSSLAAGTPDAQTGDDTTLTPSAPDQWANVAVPPSNSESAAGSTNESNTGVMRDRAQIRGPVLLSQALSSFPQSTNSLEYDNLTELRKSPEYTALRRQYSGAAFKRIESLFSKIGITEERAQEIVTGSGASGFYGMVRGSFNSTQVLNKRLQSGVSLSPVGNRQALCSGEGLCVLFLPDSVAAFGSVNDLNTILDVRAQQSAPLAGNKTITQLLAKADLGAPVIGIGPGSELIDWISTGMVKELSSQLSGTPALNTVSVFQYSVRVSSKARVNMYFDCSSSLAANSLSLSLRSLSALSSFAAKLGSKGSTLPFENVSVSASENRVHLTLDTTDSYSETSH